MFFKAKAGEKQEAVSDISISLRDEEELPRSTGHVLLLGSLFKTALGCFVGLVYFLLVLVVCFILYLFIAILCILVTPLLLVSNLIVRLLQLVSNRDAYYKATNLKALIRSLMLKVMLILLIPLGIFYLLASKVSSIKHVTVYEVSIRHWIDITFMIIGLYVLSWCLSNVVEGLSPPMLWQYERGVNASQAATEIIDCLILWLATTFVLKAALPSFMLHQVMGFPTHKWIQVVIFVVIGIDSIAFCCHFVTSLLNKYYKSLDPTVEVKSFWEEGILHRKYAVYWVDGIRKNIIFVLGSMVLVLSWNLYFRSQLSSTAEDKKVVRFVTMAFTSLLILALLWLIKSCILLSWKANQVYAQLRPRLLENREELYFLGIIGRHIFDILNIGGYSPYATGTISSVRQYEQLNDQSNDVTWNQLKTWILLLTIKNACDISSAFKQIAAYVLHPKMSKKVRDDLHIRRRVRKDVQEDEQVGGLEIWRETLHDLQKMAQYFLRAQPTLSSDKYVPNMLHYLTTSTATCKGSLEQHLEQLIKGKATDQVEGELSNPSDPQKEYEWQWFKQLVDKQSHRLSSKGINESCKSSSVEINEPSTSSFHEISESNNSLSNDTKESQKIEKETLKAWLENARGTCMELANTLSSSEEVVNCMDNIMSGVLIGATFIMWLLLTGLATTNILVLIASPLLAATFIFGDTCKSLFQGIIFAYVCHPFNVGDLVIIEDKMMEVKILGVWKTIFVEIGKSDEVIYPNSELANKKVINYKSDFDWNDCLEFSLKSFESDKIEPLRKEIKDDLRKDEKCAPNHISTEALASEEDVKVIVHLKYNTENQHGMTLYERLQEKHNLRSFFSIKIWNLLKQHKTKKD